MYSELLVESMAPQLVDCPHCDRLYSASSLPIHIPKCLANPQRAAAIRQSSIERSAKEPKKPKRRSKSTGAATTSAISRNAAASRKEDEENRPRTHTIRDETVEKKKRPITKSKRPKTRDINAEEPQPEADPPNGRICFVCGERIPAVELIDHEIDCEATWRTSRRDFSPNIRCRSPQRLRIPSVDGTVDVKRVDKWAAESARRCQRAQCGRCLAELRFAQVGEHQCTRFEPTVEFFF